MDYILLTGADVGARESALTRAKELIEENLGKIKSCSKVYESEPWGFESKTTFLNQALLLETELLPQEILLSIQSIEKFMGRVRTNKQWSSRSIDIDILCAGNLIHHTDSLSIPHNLLHERLFALTPLCDLKPEWVHPLLGRSYRELKDDLTARDSEHLKNL